MKKRKLEENPDDLEIFTSKGARLKDPKITINEHSTFLFNAAFVHKAALKKFTHERLGYSQMQNAIVFEVINDDKAEGVHTLLHREGVRKTLDWFLWNCGDLVEKR